MLEKKTFCTFTLTQIEIWYCNNHITDTNVTHFKKHEKKCSYCIKAIKNNMALVQETFLSSIEEPKSCYYCF